MMMVMMTMTHMVDNYENGGIYNDNDHLPIICNCTDDIFAKGSNEKPRSFFAATCNGDH